MPNEKWWLTHPCFLWYDTDVGIRLKVCKVCNAMEVIKEKNVVNTTVLVVCEFGGVEIGVGQFRTFDVIPKRAGNFCQCVTGITNLKITTHSYITKGCTPV